MEPVRYYLNTRLSNYDKTCGSRTVLWHQFISAVTFLELDTLKSMLGYFGTGSGKTIFGCYVIANLKKIYSDWSVYVLVKKSLESVWREELAKMVTWDGLEMANKIHIIPYDVSTFHAFFFDIVKLKSVRDRSLFVIDESQIFISRCVNKDTQHVNVRRMKTTYDYIKKSITRNFDKLLLLSATPVTNSIEEFRMYVGLLRPKLFDVVPLESFCRNEIIVSPDQITRGMKLSCAAYNVQLTSALTSSEASEGFAEKRVITIEVEMSEHQKEIYRKADQIEKKSEARGFRFLTRSVCNFAYKFISSESKEFMSSDEIEKVLQENTQEFIDKPKTDELLMNCSRKFYRACEMIKQSKGKCMAYIDLTSRNGIPEFCEYLKHFGITFVEFSGRTQKTRDRDLEMFNSSDNLHGEQIKLIIISSAGTEGITLLAVQEVFVLSLLWTDATFQQLIGRSVRYNVHALLPPNERLTVINVLVSTFPNVRTADQSMLELIRHKYNMCSSISKILFESSIDMKEDTSGVSDDKKKDIDILVNSMFNYSITSEIKFQMKTKYLRVIWYSFGNAIMRGYADLENNFYDENYVLIPNIESFKIIIQNKKPVYHFAKSN
jgi:superfamily II DNA or RNA helicase